MNLLDNLWQWVREKKGKAAMDFFFLVLLIVLLLIFGYAQFQKGVFRTTGKIELRDEDEF